jgi:glyoxylate reductase
VESVFTVNGANVIGSVFVTRRIREAGLQRLRDAGARVTLWEGAEHARPSRDEILRGIREADVVLSLLTESIDAEVLAANPELRGVANYAVGVDNIDVETASGLGIPVSNTPDVLTETTADLTWALLLSVTRRVVEGDAFMRSGAYRTWGPNLLLGDDVSPGGDGRRRTLGIVGFGRIGRAVARRAHGFGLEVLAHSRDRESVRESGLAEWVSLEELLERSDFVSIHTPLTPSTHHLIGPGQIDLMSERTYLVNTSRGPVVDERALVEALRHGRIAGAGLDVYENEPRMSPGLAELDNVVLLPHLGSATRGTRDRMATMAAENALAMLRGERAPDCVNPEVYDRR